MIKLKVRAVHLSALAAYARVGCSLCLMHRLLAALSSNSMMCIWLPSASLGIAVTMCLGALQVDVINWDDARRKKPAAQQLFRSLSTAGC